MLIALLLTNDYSLLGFGGLTFIVAKPVAILQNRIQAATATTEYVLNEKGPMTVLVCLDNFFLNFFFFAFLNKLPCELSLM